MVKNMNSKLLAVAIAALFSGNAFADVLGNGTLGGGGHTDSVLIVDDNTTGTGTAGSVTIDGVGTVATADNAGNTATLSGTNLDFSAGGTLTNVTTINGTAVSSLATTTQINALDSRIDRVSEKAYSGIASVAALAAIPGPAEGKRFSVGVGVGHYEGESAFAVGANASVTPNLNVKVGVGHSSGNTTANAGASFSW